MFVQLLCVAGREKSCFCLYSWTLVEDTFAVPQNPLASSPSTPLGNTQKQSGFCIRQRTVHSKVSSIQMKLIHCLLNDESFGNICSLALSLFSYAFNNDTIVFISALGLSRLGIFWAACNSHAVESHDFTRTDVTHCFGPKWRFKQPRKSFLFDFSIFKIHVSPYDVMFEALISDIKESFESDMCPQQASSLNIL